MPRTSQFLLALLLATSVACSKTDTGSDPSRTAPRKADAIAPTAPSTSPGAEAVTGANAKQNSSSASLRRCQVALIEEAQVPAQEAGVLKDLGVQLGDQVQAGQLLGQIDDTKTKMEVRVAQAKLDAAKAKAEDEINVIYADAAAKVADAVVKVSEEANRKVYNAVPKVEMDQLKLKRTETELGVDKAKLDRRIAGHEANVAQADLDAAQENINRRKIRSPVDGMVVELHRHAGEWVQPGDPVLRIIRMDRLWVEDYVNAEQYNPNEIVNRPAKVSVSLARDKKVPLEGKVVFVMPIVEGGKRFLVRAEVANQKDADGHWILSPGRSAEMTIQLK